MAEFKNLIKDIHGYLNGDHGHEDFRLDSATSHNIIDMAKRLATHTLELADHKPREPKDLSDKSIRMSEIGEPCMRKLLYKWYHPEYGLPPHAENGHPTLPIKFLFGDYMEELVLFLAAEAGHTIRNRQDELRYYPHGTHWWAIGHTDAMIDEYLVDVKSAADVSFNKYKREGLTADNDTFGYRWQLDAYAKASGNHKRAFIFINKHDGELLVIDRSKEPLLDLDLRIEAIGENAELGVAKAPRMADIHDAKGYGQKLGTVCSYCAFKWNCKKPEGWIVSGRPVYYTLLTAKGAKYLEDKQRIPPPEAYKGGETVEIRGEGGSTDEEEGPPF
jgi:hypothetical protein